MKAVVKTQGVSPDIIHEYTRVAAINAAAYEDIEKNGLTIDGKINPLYAVFMKTTEALLFMRAKNPSE